MVVFCAFVQNDERFVQRAASHVRQRQHFDHVHFHVLLDLIMVDHLVQGVHQGTQIGIDFSLQIARQESQALARFDRRPAPRQFCGPAAA